MDKISVILVVGALLLGGVSVTALAESAIAAEEDAPSVAIPEPRLGASLEYTVARSDEHGEEEWTVRYDLLDQSQVPDRAGQNVRVLQWNGPSPWAATYPARDFDDDGELDHWPNQVLWIDIESREPVGALMEYNYSLQSEHSHPVLPDAWPFEAGWSVTHDDRGFISYRLDAGLSVMCGLAAPVQGIAVTPGTKTAAPTCAVPQDKDAHPEWITARTFTQEGQEFAFIQQKEEGAVTAEFLFQAGVPFPVRVDRVDDDVELHLELTGYTPGTTPIDPSTPVDPLPRLEMAPRDQFGMADDGVDHAYPFREALQIASQDPLGNPFQDFMAEHPDAYVYELSYQRTDTDYPVPMVAYEWDARLFDGSERSGFTFKRQLPAGYEGLPAAMTDTVRPFPATDGPGPVPPDHPDLPEQMPTARSLMEWAEAIGVPIDRSKSGYGFEIRCSGHGCDELRIDVRAGQQWVNSTTAPGMPVQGGVEFVSHWDRVQWQFVDDWQYSGRFDSDWATEISMEAAPTPTEPSAKHPAVQDVPAIASWQRPPGSMPLAAAVAGTTISALILSKLFFGGLFTRVRRSKVLEHPVRAAIMQVVLEWPQIHQRELQRLTNTSNGQLRHHLDILRRHGYLHLSVSAGYNHWSTSEHGAPNRSLPTPAARAVLDVVAKHPGCNVREVAAHLSMRPQSAAQHVENLAQAGWIDKKRRGRVLSLRLAADAEPQLMLLRP